ncbi:MAG: tetratricopeptide repeat protein [Planctomycetaceae bacterium]|nr:tetratricopeptide repeat protein [Planctomycetaceae bacterium]
MRSQPMSDDARQAPSPQPQTRGTLMAAAIIVGAAVLVYSNTFGVPFLFDDYAAIRQNDSIRPPWSVGALLMPPGNGAAVQRRPVTNVSLAINYAISGVQPWSYHALNLSLHVLTALLLLAIVRRTLVQYGNRADSIPNASNHLSHNSLFLATLIALIWAVHPLVTEAVTYTIQRTELLAAFFYLLTLYCVIRGASSQRPTPWYAIAAGSCALAIGSKESAVSAPLVVMLYDRVFLSASWREVLRRRWPLYAAMAATWTIALILLPHGREGAAPFGHDWQPLEYAAAQLGVITHYLRLCFWPHPLVIDYGVHTPQTFWQVAPHALLIGVILIAIIIAFRRQPWLAFLGVAFFAILAPSSSIVPLFTQIAAEKRMYLPLATVVIATVMSTYVLARGLSVRHWPPPAQQPASVQRLELTLLGGLLVLLGCMTYVRNHDYRDASTIWEDAVQKCPQNARAHHNLGVAYENLGLIEDALDCYDAAIKLNAAHAVSHRNLGRILAKNGKIEVGLDHLKKAVTLAPDDAEAHCNLSVALASSGRIDAAIYHLRAAVRLSPRCADTHNALGLLLLQRGEADEAIAHFQQALDLTPSFAAARHNLDRVLAQDRIEKPLPERFKLVP